MLKSKILLFIFLCFFVSNSDAQSFNNSIVNDKSSWSTLTYGLGANNVPCCLKTEYVFFEGDSINDNLTYKKTFSTIDKLYENVKYEGLMREEDMKVYFIPASSEIEYLLYDFSLNIGDCFNYRYLGTQEYKMMCVSDIDFIKISGSMKKRMKISVNTDFESIIDTWIEEIGSLSGILKPCCAYFSTGSHSNLLCYSKENEIIYKNANYSECFYDKIEDVFTTISTIKRKDLCIFPNPVDEILNISWKETEIACVQLFDSVGQLVYNQSPKSKIDVSSFSKGVYFLRILDSEKGTIFFKKIIKK